MRTAKTVLTVIQERGKQKKPIERVYKLLFNRELYLNAYANKEIAGAFGCILRCGTTHTRENGRDGSAVIRIKKEDFEYELKESILKEFLEADSEYLIFPEKDNYISL